MPKSFLTNKNFEILPAFTWKGITYYMFKDPINTVTGRGLTSMGIYEELLMRCSTDYLKNHAEAVDKTLAGPKVNLGELARLNRNLKERINFLVTIPDQIFKLASVTFFTKNENPYQYDAELNKKKIAAWSKDKDMHVFLLEKTQLKDLVPMLAVNQEDANSHLEIQKKISEMHLKDLQKVLHKNPFPDSKLN